MKVIIQRVNHAQVVVEKKIINKIDKGYLLYICFEKNDTEQILEKLTQKIANLRIFEDQKGKMNQDISQVSGKILSISQFTLSWDGKKGNRPSFDQSMHPADAEAYYNKFNNKLRELNLEVFEGIFGADMKILSENDGPVTFSFSF